MKNFTYLGQLTSEQKHQVLMMMLLSSNFEGILQAVKDGYGVNIQLLETLYRCGYEDLIEQIKEIKEANFANTALDFFRSYLGQKEYEEWYKARTDYREAQAKAIAEAKSEDIKNRMRQAFKDNGDRFGENILEIAYGKRGETQAWDRIIETFGEKMVTDFLFARTNPAQNGFLIGWGYSNLSADVLIEKKMFGYLRNRLQWAMSSRKEQLLLKLLEAGYLDQVYQWHECKIDKLLIELGYDEVFRKDIDGLHRLFVEDPTKLTDDEMQRWFRENPDDAVITVEYYAEKHSYKPSVYMAKMKNKKWLVRHGYFWKAWKC